jgi:20S proteasome alpha/beta subunit
MHFQQLLLIASLLMTKMASLGANNPFLFDSNGRIPQVDAAFEAAAKGGTALAMKGSDSIVILTYSNSIDSSALQYKSAGLKKIRMLCKSVAYCASGIMADSLYLSNRLFEDVTRNVYEFGTEPSIQRISKVAADMLHQRTLGQQRPLGLKVLLSGWDSRGRLHIIEVDPIGNMHSCQVSCIGKKAHLQKTHEDEHLTHSSLLVGAYANHIVEELDKSVNLSSLDTLSLIRLAINTLRSGLEKEMGQAIRAESIVVTAFQPQDEGVLEAELSVIESAMNASPCLDFKTLCRAVQIKEFSA